MPIRIKNSSRYLCWKCNYSSEVTFYFSTTYPAFFTTYGEIIYKAFSSDIMAVSIQERQGSMKIRIELEEGLAEDEVVIRCRALSDEIRQIQNVIGEISTSRQSFALYKGDAEYYVALEDILFFETESNLSTTSVAAFSGSYKQVFVSRHYVRQLKEKLTEMRMR